MKTHFFEFALPAIAGIYDELENGLRCGHGSQRSLGTRIGRISTLALLCTMGAGAAAGQEASNEPIDCVQPESDCVYLTPAPLVLEQVTVLSGETDYDHAASVTVIPGDEIERLNALRLGDVLADVPGVFFSGLNGPRETPQIRNTLSFCLLYTSPSPRDRG